MLTTSQHPPLALVGGGGCHGNYFPPYAQSWPIFQIFYLPTIFQPSGVTQWGANPVSVVSQLPALHPAILSYIEMNGWREFIAVHSGEFSMYTESLKIATVQTNLTLKLELEVDSSSEVDIASSLAILKETKERVILLHFEVTLAVRFLCSSPAIELVGRYIWLLPVMNSSSEVFGVFTSTCQSNKLKDILNSVRLFTPEESQVQPFLEESIGQAGLADFVHDAAYTLAYILNQTISKIGAQAFSQFEHPSYALTEELKLSVPTIKLQGYTGNITFTESGSRILTTDIWGIEENGDDLYLLASYNGDSKQIEPVIAIDFEEENFIAVISRWKNPSAPVFYCMCCLGAIGIIFAFFLLCFNLKNKDNKMIKLTSPNINILVCCGGILSYSCMILLALHGSFEDKFEKILLTVIYALPISFDVIYVGLTSKLWRVQLIFRKTRVKRKGIKDEHLFAIVAASLILDIVLVTIWNQLDPIRCQSCTLFTNFQAELSTDVTEMVQVCSSKMMSIWTLLMALYKAIILVFCVSMAWKIRNMSLPLLKETTQIFVSVSVTSILAVVLSSISLVDSGLQPDGTYLLFSLTIFVSVSVTLGLAFIPKIFILKSLNRQNGNERFDFSSSANLVFSKNRFGGLLGCCRRNEEKSETFSADCLYKEIENTKQELKEKEKTIRELVDRLYFGPEHFQKYLDRKTTSSTNNYRLEQNSDGKPRYFDNSGTNEKEKERDHQLKMPKMIDSDSAIENPTPSISDSEKPVGLSHSQKAEIKSRLPLHLLDANKDVYPERSLIPSSRECDPVRYYSNGYSSFSEGIPNSLLTEERKVDHYREHLTSDNPSYAIHENEVPNYNASSFRHKNSLNTTQKSVLNSISSAVEYPHHIPASRNFKEIYL